MKTTKKKKTRTPHTISFQGLVRLVEKHEKAVVLLKTAVQTEWLGDGDFFTTLSEKELVALKEILAKYPNAKRVQVAELNLPSEVGPMIDNAKQSGSHVRLTVQDRTETVDASLYLTMKKRHPNAMVYLSPDEGGPVIFSEKSTVALLSVRD